MIIGNVIGGIMKIPDTIILVDEEDDKEYTAVSTNEEVELDATANDIRLGTTAATETGVTEGKKVIPAYHTNEGVVVISAGEPFVINKLSYLDAYDYTKLQAIICDFNSSLSNSVAASKVVINDDTYDVGSVVSISATTKNKDNKTIEFGIINETSKPQILRFFTYKEIE